MPADSEPEPVGGFRIPHNGRVRRLATVILLGAGLGTLSSATLRAQTLAGETFAGAFATMTTGARCPSTAAIDFIAQGPADGELSGLFNDKGTLTLAFDRNTSNVAVDTLASEFEINRAEAVGHILWDRTAEKPLQITCDDLTIRIEGRVRYTVTRPFMESGFADVSITGSRRGIDRPYFGKVTTTFLPAR